MAFDGVFLNCMIKELSPLLIGARVDKVFQPTKNVCVLNMRGRSFTGKLLISADPSGARIQLTDAAIENPASPPMLCMLLRKRLVGAKLCAVTQPGLERVVFLEFDASNELGDRIKLTLACEVMGRRSNIILLDENGKVIDAVRRTDASDTARILMPGASYSLPPAADRLDITKTDSDDICRKLINSDEQDLTSALIKNMQGFCPLVCREIEHDVTDGRPLPPSEFGSIQKDRLKKKLCGIGDICGSGKCSPVVLKDGGGKPFDFCYMPICQYEGKAEEIKFDTLSKALDFYYAEREQKARMHLLSQDLLKQLSNASSRIAKKINIRKAELEKARNSDFKRKYGELIKANIHTIRTGDVCCTVTDYYSPELEQITIPLNPALSPAQNAQKYFKEYRKACTASQLLEGFIEKGKEDLKYIDSVFDELSRAKSSAELSEIRSELAESGFIKAKSGKKVKEKPLPPIKLVSSDGFVILAGRNNRQNDRLTLKDSEKNDIWFHVKDNAGSHVIIKSGGAPVPDRTMTEAATVAATFSKASESQGVAVDFCPVRRVKKPSGAPFGLVIYENYNTAFVTPDKKLVNKLEDNAKTEEKI